MSTISESAKIILGPGSMPVGDRSIGAMLIDNEVISAEAAEQILRYAKDKGMRFGDAAVALKLVRQEDIQRVLSQQFDYPYLRPGDSSVTDEVVAAWRPFSPQVEAMRALRSQLLLRWFTGDEGRKCLAVVSPNRGDGRSHLAANLAVVFSQMGERTLLIDADLRHPRQNQLFGLGNTAGLSSVLAERAGLEAIQRIPAFLDLSVLPAGPTPPNPLELLGRGSFATFMEGVAAHYDVAILDTPPAIFGSDFQFVATKAGAALMVARKNRTGFDDCRDVAEGIAAANATLVGGVFNEI